MSAKEVSNSWFPAPKMWWARFSRRMETPIVLMRGARWETPVRPRSGRRATRPSRYPREGGVHLRHDHHPDERPEHEDLAVGHVDDVQHAEDEGVPQGDDGVDAPQGDAVDQLLGKHETTPARSPRSAEELELAVPDDEDGGLHDDVALLVEGECPKDPVKIPDPRERVAQRGPVGLACFLQGFRHGGEPG